MFKFILVSIFFISCTTSHKPKSYRQIVFNSRPPGAEVILDDIKIGKTPTVVRIEKKSYSKLVFRKTGFKSIVIDVDNSKFDNISFLDIPLDGSISEILSKIKIKYGNRRMPANLKFNITKE